MDTGLKVDIYAFKISKGYILKDLLGISRAIMDEYGYRAKPGSFRDKAGYFSSTPAPI